MHKQCVCFLCHFCWECSYCPKNVLKVLFRVVVGEDISLGAPSPPLSRFFAISHGHSVLERPPVCIRQYVAKGFM